MFTARKFISSALDDCLWFDITEGVDELLAEWYDEDLSQFNIDDRDLAFAIMMLRDKSEFWHNCKPQLSQYQKLRMKYDALLEAFVELAEDYKAIVSGADP